MLPLNTQIPQNQNGLFLNSNTTNVVKTQIRPSSPRHFFARLYGHLENNDNDTRTPVNESNLRSEDSSFPPLSHSASSLCDISYQSDGASTSSPDISISDERCV